MEKEIQENYKKPGHPTAFGGISQLERYYNKKGGVASRGRIQKALQPIDSYVLHQEAKQLTRNPTYIHFRRQQFQV